MKHNPPPCVQVQFYTQFCFASLLKRESTCATLALDGASGNAGFPDCGGFDLAFSGASCCVPITEQPSCTPCTNGFDPLNG
jgi:hypothetical protein